MSVVVKLTCAYGIILYLVGIMIIYEGIGNMEVLIDSNDISKG